MHGSRALYFKIPHARQSKISTKLLKITQTKTQNLKMLRARQSIFHQKIVPCTIL